MFIVSVNFGFLMVLVFIVVVVALAYRRRRIPSARQPRPRHLVTRIVCGTLGAAILAAIAVGTWQEVQRSYAADAAGPFTVRVPTRAAPAPSPSKENIILADKARLLVHFVIGESTQAGLRPVHTDEIEIRWPEDKGRRITRRFEAGEAKGDWGVTLQLALVEQNETNRSRHLRPNGTLHLSYRHGHTSGSGMSGFSEAGCLRMGDISKGYTSTPPLSILTGTTEELQAFGFVTIVAGDDPLKTVPLDEFLQSRRPEIAGLLRESSRHSNRGRHDYSDNVPVRGFALAGHIGVSSLLLLVAAVLLAQLFTRRNLAFAGVLAGVILYVAALERAALGVHLSKLADSQAPLPARLTACREAPGTFFHRGTALRELRAVSADAKAPATLRAAASDSLSGWSQRVELDDE